MKDSVTYQAIVMEGKVEALRDVLLRQGVKRFGRASETTESALLAANDVDRLIDLTNRVLDVSSWEELLDDQ